MFGKSSLIAATAALMAAAPSVAHMTMSYPAPVFASNNPFNGGNVLDTYTAPMSGREQFPCRDSSVIDALGTDAGSPVDTWSAGEARNITITGGAFHGGGSCQLSLSYDQGTTFKVIKSFIGNCPSANGETSYDVTVPSDAPSGDAVFAWTWFNKIGNREMYMNCAVVTISGSSSKRDIEAQKRDVAFDNRPNIFVANIDGTDGCQTSEMIDVDFPNPGEEVVRDTDAAGLYVDEAKCSDPDDTGAGTPSNSDSGSGSGDDSGSGGDSGSSTSAEASAEPTTTDAAATSSSTMYVSSSTSYSDMSTESSVESSFASTTTSAAASSSASSTSGETATSTGGVGPIHITFTKTTTCYYTGNRTTTASAHSSTKTLTYIPTGTIATVIPVEPAPSSENTMPVSSVSNSPSSASSPGGVFVTTPADGATTSAASSTSAVETETEIASSSEAASTTEEAANPTTFMTSTKTEVTTTAVAGTSASTSAAATATAAPGTSEGGFTVGEACDTEGEWNCISGSAFQRCASGIWSAVISMAAGTTCEAGISETFVMHRKRGGSRIVEA
ncbi:hypothetical protein MKZ38_002343 [Zalerion maritima]|uniref:Uncharacterized protein n=1 Tax=Zalerion maritima TaxID=339359 RepID=A0AAD5WWU6_9PEZI|nr:hypothetical protein MKZ38_002343 [Zalerion maritima]